MTTSNKVVGERVGRVDGPEKTTGRAEYVVDVAMPGMLWCKVLRSPFPHARVLHIDASRALALPGVHAVLTGEDVRGLRSGNLREDEPVLSSWDRVRFVGDKVAAVAAESEDIAEQALALIDVEYEELPAAVDPEEAAKPEAPVLHPAFNEYRRVQPMEKPGNVWERTTHEWGDLQKGFAEADVVVEQTYRTPKAHQTYLEPHACLVSIDTDGRVQVWVTSQAPTAKRVALARLLGVPREQLRINAAYIGGSFGGKGDATGVALCYLFAKKTGRPVKFVMDYAEELAAMNPRHSSIIRIRAGVRRDGRITAWEADGTFGTGAYAGYAPEGGLLHADTVVPYAIENVRITSRNVYTNQVPSGYFRGPGSYQSTFASESHMDVIARTLGNSPVDVRLVNIRAHAGAAEPSGRPWLDPGSVARLEETVRTAAEASGYDEPAPANVGRGMAVAMAGTGGMDGHAEIRVFESGQILAYMPTFDPGVGIATVLAQVVAEELDVPIERVRVEPWSTDESPRDWGFGGSRGSRVTSVAGYEAASDLKRKVARLAAEFFGWREERIGFRSGQVVDEATGQAQPLEEIAARAGSPVSGRADINEEEKSVPSFAAHVAEVEVDPETGAPRLVRYTAVHETGRVLNPIGFTAQIEGGAVMALGHALTEEIVFDPSDGRVTNPSLADYKIPTVRDIPPLKTVVLESAKGHGPYQVRAIADIPILLPAPAVANAIAAACGARITELPATSEKIYKALQRGEEP